jgi:ascorbate-specific PTS system EIIC-type component UlaA
LKLPMRQRPGSVRESGLTLMGTIIALLVGLILATVLLHLARLGVAMYELNSASDGMARELERARQLAIEKNQRIAVMFQVKRGQFGTDRNGNGKLDNAEAVELPAKVSIAEDAIIIFSSSGKLAPDSQQPRIVVTNEHNTKTVSVSSVGDVEIE